LKALAAAFAYFAMVLGTGAGLLALDGKLR
jgi:hypothetical protein